MQKMSDDPIVTCEKCGGALHKVLHPVAIHFKGSGFYTTDYGKGSGRRTGGRESGSDESSPSSSESSSKSSSGDGDPAGTDKKPASGDGKARETQKAT
jgi:predicted nucleic acid-binding Zn ribbon protein